MAGILARVGRIDRRIGEPPCARRCRRTDARNLAVGRRAIERGRADVEAAAGSAQHLIDPQGASLLDDESEVMGQMLDRTVHHLGDRPIAPIAHDSRPLPRLRW